MDLSLTIVAVDGRSLTRMALGRLVLEGVDVDVER
jgi:hypothetical protein